MKRITISTAHRQAASQMGKPVKACGFDERVVGDKCVSTFFYSLQCEEIGTVHRADVYVEGKRRVGYVID